MQIIAESIERRFSVQEQQAASNHALLQQQLEAVEARTSRQHQSMLGSTTHTELWSSSVVAAHGSDRFNKSLPDFFEGLGFNPTVGVSLPRALSLDFQTGQVEQLSKESQYEVKVTQPTFMHAISTAVKSTACNLDIKELPPDLSEVNLDNTRVLRMFKGSKRYIRGHLAPDFGVFLHGYKSTEFSALVIGEADNKASVLSNALTDNHKGENLVYQREVLQLCPFRSRARTFVYSFLTNNRTVQFLRSRVTGVDESGNFVIEDEASQEVDMATGWPYLWQLLHATPTALGHSLPKVSIGAESVEIEKVVGSGVQGVCYLGKYSGGQVVVKLSSRHASELFQERRALGALREHGEIKLASIEEAKSADDEGDQPDDDAPPLRDGSFLLDAAGQACLPYIVAYGPGVLIMRDIGESFSSDECAKRGGLRDKHVTQLLALHSQLVKVGAFHMDICPRHMMCHASDGGLLLIDWGFASLPGDVGRSRHSGKGMYSGGTVGVNPQPVDSTASAAAATAAYRACRQLRSIVKTVYGLTNAEFMKHALFDPAASSSVVWEQEWAESSSAGRVWREMVEGTGIDRLSSFVRGGT
jgi:hypothetical protein